MDDDNLRQKRFDAQLPATVVPKTLKARLMRYIQGQRNAGFTINQSEVVRIALTQFLDRGATVHLAPEIKNWFEGYSRSHNMTLDQAVQHALQWFMRTQGG